MTLSDYQTEISLNAYGITDQGSCSTFDLRKGEEITTIELGYAQDQVTSLKLVTNYESFLSVGPSHPPRVMKEHFGQGLPFVGFYGSSEE